MSDLVNRAMATVLRNGMFPALSKDVQQLFAEANDPVLGKGPNIRMGHLSELGANPAFPIITVFSEGNLEGLTRRTYRHLTATVDCWTSADQAGNINGRRLVAILAEYCSQFLQDMNFSGDGLSIQRCYETRASDIIFEPATKLYHISTAYRVEAISNTGVWY
jgi:hypothetical protein